MKGNLFSVVYDVAEDMYGVSSDESMRAVRRAVEDEIEGRANVLPLRYLLFKITNRCNSNCEYCSHAVSNVANERKSDIPLDLVKRTICEASELGATALAINGGEPLLRDDIEDIVRLCIDERIVPVLMTNGILLPDRWKTLGEAGLRYVIISFDSIRPEIYELQRGQEFNKALAGIDAAVEMMATFPGTKVHVSAVLTKDNMDTFLDLIRFMTDRGIAVQISPYHHYDTRKTDSISITERKDIRNLVQELLDMKEGGYLVASSTGFIEHLEEFFANRQRVPSGYRCKIGYTNLFIDAYGDIRPCWDWCFEPLGKLGEISLEDAWSSSQMQNYRLRMLDCKCDGCWYMCTGEVSMLLEGRL